MPTKNKEPFNVYYTFGITPSVLEIALVIMMITLTGRNLISGVGFIAISGEDVSVSPTYDIMLSMIPIGIWGLFFILTSFLCIISIFLFISRARAFYVVTIVSGGMGAFLWSVYTMASFASSQANAQAFSVHSWGYAWTTFQHLALVFMGVAALWQIRQMITNS